MIAVIAGSRRLVLAGVGTALEGVAIRRLYELATSTTCSAPSGSCYSSTTLVRADLGAGRHDAIAAAEILDRASRSFPASTIRSIAS